MLPGMYSGMGVVDGPPKFEGFTIDIPFTSNYVVLYEIRMINHDDVAFTSSCSAMSESYLSYASISAGQVCGNITYGTNIVQNYLLNGQPNPASGSSAVGGQVQSNTSSSGLKLFVKPVTPCGIKHLDIAFNNYYGYPGGSVNLYAGNSAQYLTPSSSPFGLWGYFQTTGNGNGKWYRWSYPEDPT